MEGKRYTFAILTLGCRVNQYESDCITSQLIKLGFAKKSFAECADIYIINTCTVTGGSDKKSAQMMRRARNKNGDAIIAVCGCYSQNNPNIPYADIVVGTKDKSMLPSLIMDFISNRRKICKVSDVADGFEYEKMDADFSEHTRVYVKIEDGCAGKCSYCVIPKVRGGVRSRPYDDILTEIQRFSTLGYSEVVLTGIEISSYGSDFGEKNGLLSLTERLNGEKTLDNIKSIRLSSLDPAVITDEFTKRIATLDKLCPHFHLSLQSGSDSVLKKMRRKYNISALKENLAAARERIADLNLSADIIVGFPQETEDDFLLTQNFIIDEKIYRIHVFPYSKRPETDAAELPGQIPEYIKKERVARLLNVSRRVKSEILQDYTDRKLLVILEDFDGRYFNAKTKNYIDMKVESDGLNQGSVVYVQSYRSDGEYLYAKKSGDMYQCSGRLVHILEK